MVRWLRWHCPPDTRFENRALAVWGRARYLSVTEAPRNTDFHTWMGKKHFLFLLNRRDQEPNLELYRGANHYPRAPAPYINILAHFWIESFRSLILIFRSVPWFLAFRFVIQYTPSVKTTINPLPLALLDLSPSDFIFYDVRLYTCRNIKLLGRNNQIMTCCGIVKM